MKDSIKERFRYSMSVTTEKVPSSAPIILRGEMMSILADAKELGYDAVELQLRDAQKVDGEKIQAFCNENDFGISAISTGLESALNGLSMISDKARIRQKTLLKLKQHVDLASRFECPVIIGCIRGNIPAFSDKAKYMKYFVSGLIELVEYAADVGVVIVVEAINSYLNNYLNTVKETCDFIRELGYDNLKIHIDTHHMNIEDYDPIEAVLYCKGTIGYVHFAEINRMVPGQGNMDFEAVMKALCKANYEGYITLECIPVPDQYAAAKNGIDYLKKI